MIFEFSSWSLLGPILDQFWLHFGSQNPTKSAPRGLQSRSKKWSKNLLSLGSIFKRFLVIFGPKWKYFFAAVKSQKSEKSEPWAQNVIQAFRTGSQALKILKNHENMKGEITFFQKKVKSANRYCCHFQHHHDHHYHHYQHSHYYHASIMHASIMIGWMTRASSSTK